MGTTATPTLVPDPSVAGGAYPAGDTIRVPAGLPALYHAPVYARMLYVYGPNPEGRLSTTFASGDTTASATP